MWLIDQLYIKLGFLAFKTFLLLFSIGSTCTAYFINYNHFIFLFNFPAMPEPDDIISPIGHTRMGGQRGQVREFCANCEQFGHSADKCENEEVETF